MDELKEYIPPEVVVLELEDPVDISNPFGNTPILN